MAASSVLTTVPKWNAYMEAQQKILRFTIPSVATSTTSEVYIVNIPKMDGMFIKQVKASCSSTDFDLYIGMKDGFTLTDNSSVAYAKTAANLNISDSGLNLLFYNEDSEDKMYVVVKNDDGSNATGSIDVKVAFGMM